MYKWCAGVYLLPGSSIRALPHPSSVSVVIYSKEATFLEPLISFMLIFYSLISSAASCLLPLSPSKTLNFWSPLHPPPFSSAAPHLFPQPHLNKISQEFPYSINRSGHVQALAPCAYPSSSRSSPFSWSSFLCREFCASNPSINDISASFLCPIRGCVIVRLTT